MLPIKCREDRPTRSYLITIFITIEMRGKGAFAPFMVNIFFQNVWPSKGTSLVQTGSFDVSRVKIGSAVGISRISKSVTEIQNNAGVLAAILISASHQMSAKMNDHADRSTPILFYKLCTKTKITLN